MNVEGAKSTGWFWFWFGGSPPRVELDAGRTYLHGAVEEAAVLTRFVQQSFGGGQRQHAPGLVGFPQIAPRLPEELYPCH